MIYINLKIFVNVRILFNNLIQFLFQSKYNNFRDIHHRENNI